MRTSVPPSSVPTTTPPSSPQATIPGGGAVNSIGFELVRHNAKMEAPLVQLITSPTIISTIAEVTFYGRDQAGNEISATSFMGVDFGDFADDND